MLRAPFLLCADDVDVGDDDDDDAELLPSLHAVTPRFLHAATDRIGFNSSSVYTQKHQLN